MDAGVADQPAQLREGDEHAVADQSQLAGGAVADQHLLRDVHDEHGDGERLEDGRRARPDGPERAALARGPTQGRGQHGAESEPPDRAPDGQQDPGRESRCRC